MPEMPEDFQLAADPMTPPRAPAQVAVTLPLGAEVVAYFQSEAEPSDWRKHINGVLRLYVDTNLLREAEFERAALREPAAPSA